MGEKRFRGAPFGTQKARFDVSAVHPQRKMPGTYTEAYYCKKATSKENCLLGPTTYMTDKLKGDFTERSIRRRSAGPNWKRAYESARMSAIPHMLYKDMWEQKHQLVEQLGPGRYSTKDFIEEKDTIPSSFRGVCDTLGPRFQQDNKLQADIPGPGSYGEGGVPSALLEKRHSKSASTLGMIEGSRKSERSCSTSSGSGLAPGVYYFESPIDQLLTKTVSARGPYDLLSGPRIPRDRHLQQNRHMCPGRYQIKSFTDELNNSYKVKYGKLSSVSRNPMPPPERIYCSTLSQWPRLPGEPGPGYYDYDQERPKTVPQSSSTGAFNTTARRFPKHKTEVLVGAAQYNTTRIESCWHKNGNCSVFVSKCPRLPPKVDSPRERMLKERITPRGISPSQRQFLVPFEGPRNCIASY